MKQYLARQRHRQAQRRHELMAFRVMLDRAAELAVPPSMRTRMWGFRIG